MPQAPQTLVVKDANLNDVTYDLIAPAAGYGAVAEYASKLGATVRSAYKRFTILVRDSKGPKASKITQMKVTMPFTRLDLLSNTQIVAGRAEMNITVTLPADYPVDDIPNFVAHAQNLLQTTLVTAVLTDGGPAT